MRLLKTANILVLTVALVLIALVSVSCAKAEFTLSALEVIPATATPGEEATVSVTVANIGKAEGTHGVELTVNGDAVEKRYVVLAPGVSEIVTFKLVRQGIGTYILSVDGQSQTLNVKSPSALEQMLSVIPDTPGTRSWMVIDDYARAREIFGIAQPGPDADEETIVTYVTALYESPAQMNTSVFLSGMGPYTLVSPIRRKNVGFGPQDMDIIVTAGNPPRRVEILKGRFDAERTAAAISTANVPEVARERYAKQVYRGVIIHSWGDGLRLDLANKLSSPVFDQLGRAQPMAVLKDYAFRCSSIDGVKTIIDFSMGDKSSLNGVTVDSLWQAREFKLLAEGFGDIGAYSFFLSDQVQKVIDYPGKGLESTPLLRAYQTFAWASAKDEKGLYTALVLVHNSADFARENVDLLRRRIEETSSLQYNVPWKTLLPIEEIRAEGPVLFVKIRRDHGAKFGMETFYSKDPLLLQDALRDTYQ